MSYDAPLLTPALLLRAYAAGVFPMSEHRDDPEIFWVDPRRRGIFDLPHFHISRSLARAMRRADYSVTANAAFADVMRGCADRPETWINDTIFTLYSALHDAGHAHSVEIWRNGDLIGGVYGVTLGRAFFGESMFSRATNGSKIALAHLVDQLNRTGFILFDTQFITDHLASLGAVEIPRVTYHTRLKRAVTGQADFASLPIETDGYAVLQRNTQTS